MSLKAKLVSTIAAFCMVICLLSVGIWAASTGTVTVGGTVSFEATDVNVTVTGTVSGAKVNTWTDTITWSAEDATAAEVWDGLLFEFVQNTTDTSKLDDIVISLKIDNLSTERGILVTLEKTSTDTDDVSVTVDTANEAKVAAEGTTTLKITIKALGDANSTIDATGFGAKLTIKNDPNQA